MGLRESLQDLFTMQSAAASGAEATDRLVAQQQLMQKQKDLRQLAQEIPSAIQQGDLSQVAGQAYGLGDPSILRSAIDQQLAQQKMAASAGGPQDSALTGKALRAAFPGMGDDWYKAAEGATSRTQQRQEFTALGSQMDRDADRGLRKETQFEATRDRFAKSMESNLKKYRENKEAFERLGELDPRTNIGFWPQVSTIIKKVGMDAGALSDQDMSRFIASTGQRTMTQALQYIGAIDPSKANVDDQTIKAVTSLISKMKGFSDQKYKERGVSELKKQIEVRGDRLNDDLIKEQALELGVVASKKDGKWQIGDEVELGRQKVDVDMRGVPGMQQMLQKLPGERQAKYIEKLKMYEKEPAKRQAVIDLLMKEAK